MPDEIRDQNLEAVMAQERELFNAEAVRIHCGCGRKLTVWRGYKCLYCGIIFCRLCAEAHFGATVEEHIARTWEPRSAV